MRCPFKITIFRIRIYERRRVMMNNNERTDSNGLLFDVRFFRWKLSHHWFTSFVKTGVPFVKLARISARTDNKQQTRETPASELMNEWAAMSAAVSASASAANDTWPNITGTGRRLPISQARARKSFLYLLQIYILCLLWDVT